MFPAPLAHLPGSFPIRREIANSIRQRGGILRLDGKSGAGFLQNAPRLAIDPEDDRPRARHEFQHLGRYDSLEQLIFPERHQANVRGGDVSGNILSRLLVDKAYVVQAALARQRNNAILLSAFPRHQKDDLRNTLLYLSG